MAYLASSQADVSKPSNAGSSSVLLAGPLTQKGARVWNSEVKGCNFYFDRLSAEEATKRNADCFLEEYGFEVSTIFFSFSRGEDRTVLKHPVLIFSPFGCGWCSVLNLGSSGKQHKSFTFECYLLLAITNTLPALTS